MLSKRLGYEIILRVFKMCEVPQRLLDIYIPMRTELKQGINKLKADIVVYDKQFEEKGPMVKGLLPSDAVERYKNSILLPNYF